MPRGRGRSTEPCCGRDPAGGAGSTGGQGIGSGMRGLVEPAVLAALGSQPAHGYDLRLSIEELTGGGLRIDPGGLYRILRRMEDDGLVVSTWEAGDHGPQRRTYRLTGDGTDVLRGWINGLDARRRAIDGILAAAASTTDAPPPARARRRTDDAGDDDTTRGAHDDAR